MTKTPPNVCYFLGRQSTIPPESELLLFMGWGEIFKCGVADTESGLALFRG
jgi:hypothetical protein